MKRWLMILLATFAGSAKAAEIIQVTWPTKHASPPLRLEPKVMAWMPAFRMALGSVPEATTVNLALAQPALLGLTMEQAKQLQPLVAEQYRQMANSAAYQKAPSLLSYCFSEETPAHGLANVHVPDGWKAESPVLVFLHGYGGSFLWYQHYLARHFPKHLIICPAWGISPSKISPTYLSECLKAVETRRDLQIKAPWLLGLSAGGFGVLRAAAALPQVIRRSHLHGSLPGHATAQSATSLLHRRQRGALRDVRTLFQNDRRSQNASGAERRALFHAHA